MKRLLGTEVERSDYVAASVLEVEDETSSTGNVILRVGHVHNKLGPSSLLTWEQTEHVVLTPDEARALIERVAFALDGMVVTNAWTSTLGEYVTVMGADGIVHKARIIEAEQQAKRTILVHLNVEVDESDQRTADEVAEAVMGAFTVGSDDDSARNLSVAVALVDEV